MNQLTRVFSNNLRNARKTKSLTQNQIAKKIGIKLNRYAAWEEGRSAPNITHLAKLCEVLNIDDLYLFISKCEKV